MITKYKIFENINEPKNLIGKKAILINKDIDVYDFEGHIGIKSALRFGWSGIIKNVKKIDNLILISFSGISHYDLRDFEIVEYKQKFTKEDPYGEEDWE